MLPRDLLGTMSALEIVALYAAARAIGVAELELGRRAWRAFRSDDPRAIEALAREEGGPLPDVARALHRHLEQFPSVRSGLSRSERQALEALADGPLPFEDFFRAAQRDEEALFLGDAVFESYLGELAADAEPAGRARRRGLAAHRLRPRGAGRRGRSRRRARLRPLAGGRAAAGAAPGLALGPGARLSGPTRRLTGLRRRVAA